MMIREASQATLKYDIQVTPRELEHIAFSGQFELVHGLFKSIPVEKWGEYDNKYILSGVITGGIRKLRKFLGSSAEEPAMKEKIFIDGVARHFLAESRESGTYPRELFGSILEWAAELAKLSLIQEALFYYDEILLGDIRKYPDLFARTLISKAEVLNTTGNFRQSQELLRSLVDRQYLFADRNMLPELMFSLGRESLLKGDVAYYKEALFRGLRQFSTNMAVRQEIVDQIRKTYRRSYRVVFDQRISPADRLLFAMHVIALKAASSSILRILGVAEMLRAGVLGYVYYQNYFLPARSKEDSSDPAATYKGLSHHQGNRVRKRRDILITRSMGGIGDLLMMTPGLHALRRKYPGESIILAIPRRYFPVFENNTDVVLVDIDGSAIDVRAYRKWYNLSDCPASRVESRTAPRVKRTRVDIFASGVGIGRWGMIGIDRRPRYAIASHEIGFRNEFWRRHGLDKGPVVAVQMHSEEIYRDYPHMLDLVRALSRSVHVIAFESEASARTPEHNITWVSGLPLRKAFALVSGCDVIVAPDSAFVHLSAALDIPCVGLYGPIDGRIRTRHYPLCTFIDVREKLGCMPCWRNDQIPCRLTNLRTSVCMSDIGISEILDSVGRILREGGQP